MKILGRNFDGLLPIIEYCNRERDPRKTKLSIELEKIRDFNWYNKFIPLANVIFISKDFAKNLGDFSKFHKITFTYFKVLIQWKMLSMVS